MAPQTAQTADPAAERERGYADALNGRPETQTPATYSGHYAGGYREGALEARRMARRGGRPCVHCGRPECRCGVCGGEPLTGKMAERGSACAVCSYGQYANQNQQNERG